MRKLIVYSLIIILFVISCSENKQKKAVYEGEDISKNASILRDKNTKAASLKIDIPGEWLLYAGNSVDSIDFTNPIAKGNGQGIYPLNVSDSGRVYFQLNTQKGKAVLAERHLPMKGGYNFRDLGGFRNRDGRYVKWGKVFRADELQNLTERDLKYLSSIPIKTIVDFRSLTERHMAPDKNPQSLNKNYHYAIEPGNLMGMMISNMEDLAKLPMDTLMMQMNIMMVSDSNALIRYKAFFALLQNENDIPLLFHCSAGKDRTGMGAALFLASLDIDEETIMQDYLSSNQYLVDKYASLKSESPEMASMYEVKREYLRAGLDWIKENHGSIENFLEKELLVDRDKMKDLYLFSN